MLGSFHFFCPSSFSLLHSHGFDSIIFPPWLLFFLCFSDLFFFTLLFFCFFVFWLLCSLNYNFTTFLFVLQYFLFFYFVCFCIFWCFVFRFCYKLSKNSSSLFNNLSALMFFLHICLKYETSSCQNVPCNSI